MTDIMKEVKQEVTNVLYKQGWHQKVGQDVFEESLSLTFKAVGDIFNPFGDIGIFETVFLPKGGDAIFPCEDINGEICVPQMIYGNSAIWNKKYVKDERFYVVCNKIKKFLLGFKNKLRSEQLDILSFAAKRNVVGDNLKELAASSGINGIRTTDILVEPAKFCDINNEAITSAKTTPCLTIEQFNELVNGMFGIRVHIVQDISVAFYKNNLELIKHTEAPVKEKWWQKIIRWLLFRKRKTERQYKPLKQIMFALDLQNRDSFVMPIGGIKFFDYEEEQIRNDITYSSAPPSDDNDEGIYGSFKAGLAALNARRVAVSFTNHNLTEGQFKEVIDYFEIVEPTLKEKKNK